METAELILLCGCPGSGKSTFSKEFVKNNKEYYRICRDDMRLMFSQSQFLDKTGEEIITQFTEDVVLDLLLYYGKNVILDQTNCKLSYIQKWESYTSNIKIKLFDESLDVLLERNNNRTTDKVPEEVIKNMYKNLQEMKQHPEFNKYKQI